MPAPVAKLYVAAVASLPMETVPVPEFMVMAPLVAVTLKAPDPDCTVVVEVELVLPKVLV
jgi:hypothetical protein